MSGVSFLALQCVENVTYMHFTKLKMSLVFKNKSTYVLSMSRFSSRNKLERSASMIFFCQTVGGNIFFGNIFVGALAVSAGHEG